MPTCSPMTEPFALVRVEELVDEVMAVWRHVLVVVVRPGDASIQDVLKDLLGGVGAERRVTCRRGGMDQRIDERRSPLGLMCSKYYILVPKRPCERECYGYVYIPEGRRDGDIMRASTLA